MATWRIDSKLVLIWQGRGLWAGHPASPPVSIESSLQPSEPRSRLYPWYPQDLGASGPYGSLFGMVLAGVVEEVERLAPARSLCFEDISGKDERHSPVVWLIPRGHDVRCRCRQRYVIFLSSSYRCGIGLCRHIIPTLEI